MKFIFQRLEIPDLILIEHEAAADGRGFFAEVYREREFAAAGIRGPFVQENHSRSGQGVLRGLHFQAKPHAMAKLVRCVSGEIFDVAVDIRKGSPTYGQWVGVTLSEGNRRMLYMPEGFAHGFVVMSPSADVSYRQTGYYAPEAEAGVLWNDAEIAVRWPVQDPILSAKDANLPRLKDLKHAH